MENIVDAQIGQRIKELRTGASVTIAVAAERCGISRSDYERGERGDRRFTAIELHALSGLFNVELTEIFAALPKSLPTRAQAIQIS